MALTGLAIFKLLPKTNCKKCGFPTCLAFAMQLAQKKASLDKCPDASDEAKTALAAAAEPPMRLVKFGAGDAKVQTGGETVMFRHDEKFHNPTILAVTVSDTLEGDALKQRIEAISGLQFERIGQHIQVNAIAVMNESGKADAFAAAAEAAKAAPLAMILVTDSPEAMSAALEKTADARPLLCAATAETAEEMAKLAKDKACPLVAKAESPEALAEITEKIKAAGVEDIALMLSGAGPWDELQALTQVRGLALKKNFRPLGYPIIAFATEGSEYEQAARAASLICKYA
ncbi:MAG: acetyl-CoA decarbonylase/synthase complex subunit gamma, partial [Phycisphaerae bacterium]|nr:acetyl-CoA decarbonylase/synthase complex subunit gamma [Phycisphaerae bacterium]